MVRRILMLLMVAMLVVVMAAVTAGPALAAPPAQANKGLTIAAAKSGGQSQPPICDVC